MMDNKQNIDIAINELTRVISESTSELTDAEWHEALRKAIDRADEIQQERKKYDKNCPVCFGTGEDGGFYSEPKPCKFCKGRE